jgi:hypothetical protein
MYGSWTERGQQEGAGRSAHASTMRVAAALPSSGAWAWRLSDSTPS